VNVFVIHRKFLNETHKRFTNLTTLKLRISAHQKKAQRKWKDRPFPGKKTFVIHNSDELPSI
jgi:hypothetical protein